MKLTLAQIETFCWIVRLGSFQAAARRQNLAQPTVSLRIRELESEIGAVLLHRTGRKVRLTAEGTALYQDAERILALAEGIEGRSARRQPLRGLIRLGTPESFALVCLPRLIPLLEREHPQLKVEATIETSSDLMRLLMDHQMDLAIITNPERRRDLQVEPLGQHEMGWISGPQCDLRHPVRPADLAACHIISNPPSTPMYEIVLSWFRNAGEEPARLSFCNSLSVIARLCAGGLGVSVLPPSILERELSAGELRVLPSKPRVPIAAMFATYHAANTNLALDALIQAIKQVVEETGFLEPT